MKTGELPGSGPVVIIAGAGRLPAEIAAEITSRHEAVMVFALKGVANADFSRYQSCQIGMFDPAGVLERLSQSGARAVILAGAVHKPGVGIVLGAYQAVRNRDEILKVIQGGDDNLLRGIVQFLEQNGFPVLGVRDVAPALMAHEGRFGLQEPTVGNHADIACGLRALCALGPCDVGQAVIVCDQRVLAVEAVEGTDNMIRRVQALRRQGVLGWMKRHGRPVIAERSGGVLVKAAKPGQDLRVDMPVIGPRTVRLARKAGLAGIAVEAGRVLVVDRERTIRMADEMGLFITGVGA